MRNLRKTSVARVAAYVTMCHKQWLALCRDLQCSEVDIYEKKTLKSWKYFTTCKQSFALCREIQAQSSVIILILKNMVHIVHVVHIVSEAMIFTVHWSSCEVRSQCIGEAIGCVSQEIIGRRPLTAVQGDGDHIGVVGWKTNTRNLTKTRTWSLARTKSNFTWAVLYWSMEDY